MNNTNVVYKIWLKDGSFYIGSTINLKSRMSQHCTEMRNKTGLWGIFYPDIEPQDIDCVEVIDTDCSVKSLRKLENKHIAEESDNPLILNKPKGNRPYSGLTMLDIYLQKKNGAKTSPSTDNVIQ